MKIMKDILSVVFWLLIVALLIAPVGLIMKISQEEQKQYATPSAPILQESVIGGIVQATRQDVQEYVTVSGSVTSVTYGYMAVDYDAVQDVRWYISVGDEIQVGQIICSGAKGDVASTMSGIVKELHTYSQQDCYIKVQLFSPVELECRVTEQVLAIIRRAQTLTTETGESMALTFASMRHNVDGTVDIRLSVDGDSYVYGEQKNNLRVFTGRIYRNTLVLPEDCVYQKSGSTAWYVRRVTEDGVFIEEKEVQVGYSDGNVICITGVNEGEYFDSGFQAIAGG